MSEDSSSAVRGERWLYAWAGANVAIGVSSLLVPLYVVQLGGGAVELGVLWFATSVAMVPGALGVGLVLDRTGRHRTLAVGALFGAAGSLAVVPQLDDLAAVVAVDAVLWLFAAGVTPVLTVLAIEGSPESRWNARVARLGRFQGYGWAAGLVLGAAWTWAAAGRLSPLGVQRSLLWIAAGVLAVAALAAALWLPADAERTPGQPAERPPPGRGAAPFSVRGALSPLAAGWTLSAGRLSDARRLLDRRPGPLHVYLLAVGLFFAGFAMFGAPLPDFLTGAGFDGDAIFALYVVSSLSTAAFFEGSGALADRYDLRLLQSGALGARGLVFPAVAAAAYGLGAGTLSGLVAVAALFAVIGASYALIVVTANSLVARYASPRRRGAALGLYTALSAGAGGIGGLLGGWLASTLDYVVTFAAAGALVLLGSALVFGLDLFAPGSR